MGTRNSLAAALALLLATSACQPPAQEAVSSMEEDVAHLKTVADQFDAAQAAGDADGLAALYADDAVRMMPDLPAWVGNAAIRAGFESELQLMAERWSSAEIDNVARDVVVFGDWATVRGTSTARFTPANGGEPISSTAKWLAFYRRESDGTWKIVWDIWNRDAPLPEESAGT